MGMAGGVENEDYADLSVAVVVAGGAEEVL